MYKVATEKFEGPLDLLLQLIEKEKLDICQISLAKITDCFVQEISKMDKAGDEMAEFLVIAAKLLYIKSKQLLPSLETEEEEAEIADLEAKLAEYQRYKQAAEKLSEILAENNRSFVRRAKNEKNITFLPPKDLSKNQLYAIFENVLKAVPEEKPTKTIEAKKVTLEEKRVHILSTVRKMKKVSFSNILKESKNRMEVIVTFLAILEMIKQKEIRVNQTENFADFEIVGVK